MIKAFKQTFITLLLLSFSFFACASGAEKDYWQNIEQQAKGQTLYFNGWGGSPAVNTYLEWVAKRLQDDHGINVKLVKVNDIIDTIRRIQVENKMNKPGSVDLLWVNGENFKILKEDGLLLPDWVEKLPNWQLVDKNKPVTEDFAIPVDGLESPWGAAQLNFIADRNVVKQPPKNLTEFKAFAKQYPGKVSYPKPPAFVGTTFLKLVLIHSVADPAILKNAPKDEADFQQITAPLWKYLDELHPLLWKQGKEFPGSSAIMDTMLANNELVVSHSFNLGHTHNLIEQGLFPETAYAFGFSDGMIGNVHFVAIPKNAQAKEASQVMANFLLSPEAQMRKQDPKYWGDSTVLDVAKLSPEQQVEFNSLLKWFVSENDNAPSLNEPNAAWVDLIEAEWFKRYGSR